MDIDCNSYEEPRMAGLGFRDRGSIYFEHVQLVHCTSSIFIRVQKEDVGYSDILT